MSFAGRYCLLFLTVLLLTACGFHLRGSEDQFSNTAFPNEMSDTYLQMVNKTSDLFRFVQRGLVKSGVLLVDKKDSAAAILAIQENVNKQPLSYDTAGRAVEYEVFYTVHFNVQRTNIDWQIPQQNINLSRSYFFDPLDALAADRQEQQLLADMQREAARLILLRIRTVSPSE